MFASDAQDTGNIKNMLCLIILFAIVMGLLSQSILDKLQQRPKDDRRLGFK
jgi:hypothetical protein